MSHEPIGHRYLYIKPKDIMESLSRTRRKEVAQNA